MYPSKLDKGLAANLNSDPLSRSPHGVGGVMAIKSYRRLQEAHAKLCSIQTPAQRSLSTSAPVTHLPCEQVGPRFHGLHEPEATPP